MQGRAGYKWLLGE